MADTEENKDAFMTQPPNADDDSDQYDEDLSSDGADEAEGADNNQYFTVGDAKPPTNYDDPYSTLPPKVESRLDQIKVSIASLLTTVSERCNFLGDFPPTQGRHGRKGNRETTVGSERIRRTDEDGTYEGSDR